MRGFIRFAVDKPIINHIFMLFMLLLSVFAYQNIAKEIFPPSTLDMVSIKGTYMGASANVLDKMAVNNIEDELKSLSSIDTVNTSIQNGFFLITADIKTGEASQEVLNDVKDILSKIKRDLPADMDEPVARVVVHQYPLLLVAISGDVPKKELIAAAKDLKRKLSNIHDISGIDVRGDTDAEVLLTLDQKKIEAYGLDKKSIYQAISNLSSIFPVGTLDGQGEHLYISTINGEKNATALGKTLLSVGGKHIRLSDIAEVHYGLGASEQISHYNYLDIFSIL